MNHVGTTEIQVVIFSYLAPFPLAVPGIRMTLSSKYQLYADITYVTLG